MHFPPQFLVAAHPERPQLHSRKHHHIYNGSGRLPLDTWVRSSPASSTNTNNLAEAGQQQQLYEIVLYFGCNRACTIYRSRADFERLRRTITPWKQGHHSNNNKNRNSSSNNSDAALLDQLLRDALVHRPRDCALEYFLRRRMEDCGGHMC